MESFIYMPFINLPNMVTITLSRVDDRHVNCTVKSQSQLVMCVCVCVCVHT